MINLIKYIPVLLITIIFSDNRGWTHPETGWQVISGQNMCIFTLICQGGNLSKYSQFIKIRLRAKLSKYRLYRRRF